MGIVARDATEGAITLTEAPGLEDPHRLESGEVGVVGPDLAGMSLGRMTVARAAEHQQALGRESVRTKREAKLGAVV